MTFGAPVSVEHPVHLGGEFQAGLADVADGLDREVRLGGGVAVVEREDLVSRVGQHRCADRPVDALGPRRPVEQDDRQRMLRRHRDRRVVGAGGWLGGREEREPVDEAVVDGEPAARG